MNPKLYNTEPVLQHKIPFLASVSKPPSFKRFEPNKSFMELSDCTYNNWGDFTLGVLAFIGILASFQQVLGFELVNSAIAYMGIAGTAVLSFSILKHGLTRLRKG